MRRHLVPMFLLILVAASCGTTSDGGGGDVDIDIGGPLVDPVEVSLPDDSDVVVLQIDVGVNQPDPVAVSSGHPIFTLFADGRLIARDRDVESGALPKLVEARLSRAGVEAVMGEVVGRGLLDPLDDYGRPQIADASSHRFTITTATQTVEFGVSAFGSADADDAGVSADQAAAREELVALEAVLFDWQTNVAEHVIEEPSLFVGDSVLVLSDERRITDEEDALFGIRAAGVIYDTRVAPVVCTELSGDTLDELVPAITDPDAGSGWTSELRPVFPGEPGCEIVTEL